MEGSQQCCRIAIVENRNSGASWTAQRMIRMWHTKGFATRSRDRKRLERRGAKQPGDFVDHEMMDRQIRNRGKPVEDPDYGSGASQFFADWSCNCRAGAAAVPSSGRVPS